MSEQVKIFKGDNIFIGDNLKPASIVVRDGKISAILDKTYHFDRTCDTQYEIIDVGRDVLIPGIVDSHVHVNEPGRTSWEGFESATMAAAAGGVTTIIDMPLNCIPSTTSLEAFQTKLAVADGKCHVDVAFWGGIIPNNENELIPMLNAGVAGFKCFLIHSGLDDFPSVDRSDLEKAFTVLQGTSAVVLFHAEVDCCNNNNTNNNCEKDKQDPKVYSTFLSTRPEEMEMKAIEMAALWQGILDGHIDMVVSDHSPCTPDLKLQQHGDFLSAWGGISSLQFGLSLLWTYGQDNGLKLPDLVRLLCESPARMGGIGQTKGRIAVGYDADFVIWNPEQSHKIDTECIHHKNKLTPYLGRTLMGTVTTTVLKGKFIYKSGTFPEFPLGSSLLVDHTAEDSTTVKEI